MQSCTDLISRTVCEYFEARILMGQYRAGDKLPSIVEIAAAFRLAPETIRAALLLLEKQGYIRMEAKVGSWVTERATGSRDNVLFFAQRHDGIHDLLGSERYVLEPLLAHALRHMDDSRWDQLQGLCTRLQENPIIPASIQFYAQVLSALDNSLVLNLYWEMDRYIRFSYLPEGEVYQVASQTLRECSREKASAQLEAALQTAAGGLRLLAACDEARVRYPAAEQVPFHWTVYRQRHQLCYTLAARIIRLVAAGTYPVGSYLPSLPEMAKQLDVSLRTLRRTLSILGSLGVTHSFHGKGTLVCMAVEKIEFSRPEIKEGLRYYWESLQFLSLTAGPVSLFLLESMPEGELASLAQQFIAMCEQDRCHRCFDVVLDFIAQRCPLQVVRECYGTLEEFLAWGYPFTLYRLQNRSLKAEYAAVIKRTADCLTCRDWTGFAREFEALMAREAELAAKILTDYCR